MGFTIYANNGSRDFDGGMGGFMSLRTNIALAFDKEFGEHYSTLRSCFREDDYKLFNTKTNKILSHDRFKQEDKDIVEFLFACDCGGEISYKTCKKIYDLIKDIDFGGKIFTYGAYSDGKDYEHFKDFLLECYSHRRKLRWR